MAVADLNLSRRAVLGAALAAPVAATTPLSRHPGLDPGSTFFPSPPPQGRWTPDQVRGDDGGGSGAWEKALARFRAAEASLADAAHTLDDDLYDRRLGWFNAALKRLLRASAPGAAALAAKLDLLAAHEAWELTGGELCLAAAR